MRQWIATPNGWEKTEIGEIAEIITGNTPSPKNPEYYGGEIPFVCPGDLNQDKPIMLTEKMVTKKGLAQGRLLTKGTVLVSCIGILGKVGILAREGLCNQQINSILPNPYLVPEFIKLWAYTIAPWLEANSSATTVPIINKGRFSKAPIDLPPYNEQKRIALRVSALQSHSRVAKKALEAIPSLLEKFRQSVLSSAFRGDLTATWRAQNPDIESAGKLLERIRKKRRKRWEEEELAKMEAKGQTPKDDKWKNKYKEPVPVITTNLPELPDGWCWACFDEIASVDSNLVDPKTTPDLPHIAPNHIETLTGRLLEYKTVREDGVTSPKHLFHPGQILYSKIRPYLAKAVVVDFEGVCSADMYPISTPLNKVYLHNWLISPAFTDFTILKQGRTVLPKINQKDLGTRPVPVAPLKEQIQIANKLLSCTEIRDKTVKKVETSLDVLQKLDKSILSKAFRGEFVPQDPNDEPASVLLERIKLDKASLEAEKKQKGKVGILKTVTPKKEVTTMAKKKERRPLVEVLQPHSSGLPPEELFQQAGFDEHLVDEFYIELKNEVVSGNIIEDRPDQERILLRLKAA